jgi:phospholipid transport system substrate-binding protein
MTRARRSLVATLALGAVLAAHTAGAGPVADQLKTKVDAVIKTLEDPALKNKTEERRAAIRAISNQTFDWQEMAKRSLGRHWQGRSDQEREEFVKLFQNLIEAAYISKIESYSGEKVDYAAESVDGDQATVRTKIITKRGQEVPIDYRVLRRSERWMIYDVSIEGISLVSNYRTQFDRVITTSSYQELVKKIKNQELLRKEGA